MAVTKRSRATSPAIAITDTLGFRVWRNVVQLGHQGHAHSDLEWNWCADAPITYFLGGQFQTIPAGRLAVFWAGMPHRLNDPPPRTTMAWMTLPVAWALDWGLGEVFTRRLLSGELLIEPDAARREADGLAMQQWSADSDSGDTEVQKTALLEIQARLRRLAGSIVRTPRKRSGSRGHKPEQGNQDWFGRHVEQMSAMLSRNIQEQVSVADVAEAVGLHPNYAMQVFKRGCGMSLWEYLTRLRISRAQRLLLTTDSKVTAIAYESGFNSASRFYAAFTRIVGCAPREYRGRMTQPKALS